MCQASSTIRHLSQESRSCGEALGGKPVVSVSRTITEAPLGRTQLQEVDLGSDRLAEASSLDTLSFIIAVW